MSVRANAAGSVRPRLWIDGPESPEAYAAYLARGGYAATSWARTPSELIEQMESSGLRGRGGADFPTGRKWRSVAAQPGPRFLLVNGAESEPASHKDRWLLT